MAAQQITQSKVVETFLNRLVQTFGFRTAVETHRALVLDTELSPDVRAVIRQACRQ